MCSVVDQPRNVILGHLGQLFLKDTFEAGQDDVGIPTAVVIDDSKLDLAIALLNDRGLYHVS